MAGLDPAIHVATPLLYRNYCRNVDARHKAGHDAVRRITNPEFVYALSRR
jgi:hypothetical protein